MRQKSPSPARRNNRIDVERQQLTRASPQLPATSITGGCCSPESPGDPLSLPGPITTATVPRACPRDSEPLKPRVWETATAKGWFAGKALEVFCCGHQRWTRVLESSEHRSRSCAGTFHLRSPKRLYQARAGWKCEGELKEINGAFCSISILMRWQGRY